MHDHVKEQTCLRLAQPDSAAALHEKLLPPPKLYCIKITSAYKFFVY
jgi:hypothetical protein